MKFNKLGNTGMEISELSFGASSLGVVFHTIKESEAIEAVFAAVDGGINFIDVSPYYGHYKAETVLGKALKDIPRIKFYLNESRPLWQGRREHLGLLGKTRCRKRV